MAASRDHERRALSGGGAKRGGVSPGHALSHTLTALAAPRDPRFRHPRARDPLSTNTPGLRTHQALTPPGICTGIPGHRHLRAPTPEEPPTPGLPGTRIPATPEHPTGTPEHRAGTPEHPTGTTEHPTGTPEHRAGTPEHPTGTTEHPTGTPEHRAGTPEHPTGTTEHPTGTPEHRAGTPEHPTGTTEHPTGTPEHRAGTPEHPTGTTEHPTGTPEHRAGTPEHPTGTTEHPTGTPEHRAGTPGPANPVCPRQRLTKGRSSGLTPRPVGTGTSWGPPGWFCDVDDPRDPDMGGGRRGCPGGHGLSPVPPPPLSPQKDTPAHPMCHSWESPLYLDLKGLGGPPHFRVL
ncbi:PREDICTED: proteoglycan 4-like [Ficedula albicollis]|uniref:proteoglycan 4-like n=1 Tax=Ficedula albicollis TaxID=59894 RepID=UPI0007AD7CE1|nr:PREDICTED: proteoglycan 4-like [Ficedula albicollis]